MLALFCGYATESRNGLIACCHKTAYTPRPSNVRKMKKIYSFERNG